MAPFGGHHSLAHVRAGVCVHVCGVHVCGVHVCGVHAWCACMVCMGEGGVGGW